MGYSNLTLGKVSIVSGSGVAGNSGSSTLTLSHVTLTITAGNWGSSNLTLKRLTIVSGGNITSGGSTIELLPVAIVSSGYAPYGRSQISLKPLRLSTSGHAGGIGSSSFSLKKVQITSSGAFATSGESSISLPAVLVSSSGLPYSYLCLVLNNEAALTIWDTVFDSFAEYNGTIYACDSSGLYKLGGDDDNTEWIEAEIDTGLSDGGASNMKQAEGWYMGYRSDGKLRLTIVSDDEEESKPHDLRTTDDKIRSRGTQMTNGPRGRYLGAKITNTDGCDFRIVSVGVLAKLLFDRKTNA